MKAAIALTDRRLDLATVPIQGLAGYLHFISFEPTGSIRRPGNRADEKQHGSILLLAQAYFAKRCEDSYLLVFFFLPTAEAGFV